VPTPGDEEGNMTRRNSHAELEQWFQSVDLVLANQREHAISPSTVPSSDQDRTSWTTTLRVLGRHLVRLIDTLVKSPGRWILILDVGEAGGRYVQLLVHEDGSILYEASSNNFLEGSDCLSSQEEQMLESMGWTRPGGRNRPNWWAVEATIYPETKAVALRLLEALDKVFSVGSSNVINARLICSPRRGCTPASQSLSEPSLSEFSGASSDPVADPNLPPGGCHSLTCRSSSHNWGCMMAANYRQKAAISRQKKDLATARGRFVASGARATKPW
jgi:hypothetical protein